MGWGERPEEPQGKRMCTHACLSDAPGSLSTSTCLSVHPSILLCLSIHLSILLCLSVHPSILLCLSIHLSILLCLAIHPSILLCLSIHPSILLCLSISRRLFDYTGMFVCFCMRNWCPFVFGLCVSERMCE